MTADVRRRRMPVVGDGGALFSFVDVGDAASAVRAAIAMHEMQRELDAEWAERDLAAFGLGIGLSTGDVAAAMLGSAERLEYTVVGDTVNLAQRLQDLARPAGSTVASEATVQACGDGWAWEPLGAREVKGRETPVLAYRLDSTAQQRSSA
jgi:class 3 adenylate cyclase